MSAVKEITSSRINGLNVKLFEYDINDDEKFNDLKEYLINKVRKSKVHNVSDYDLTYYGSANLDPEFVKRFNDKVAEINIPKKITSIPHFDVRRERVTEWMAQLVLEDHYGCTFYDAADKRINMRTVDIDKHTPGIDVPGIMFKDDAIKFVVCEVKASESKSIPTSSANGLMDDIQKSIDNHDNRVSREILQYMHGIRNVKMKDDQVVKILDFLAELVVMSEKDSNRNLSNNVMFFPVLIRKNEDIVNNNDLSDYINFKVDGIDDSGIENIIGHFGSSINDFSNDIYKEAIENE